MGPSIALAAPGQSAEQLSAQLERLKSETKKAGDEWDRAYWRLDEVELKVEKTDKQIAKTKKELAAAQALLGTHAAGIYRRSQVSPLEVLVGAASFEDLFTRVDLMRRIGTSDAQAVAEVKRVRDKLNKQRAQLASEKRSATKAVTSLKAERDRLQSQLKAKQAAFAKVKAELDAVRGGPNRPAGVASVAGPQRHGVPGRRLVLLLRHVGRLARRRSAQAQGDRHHGAERHAGGGDSPGHGARRRPAGWAARRSGSRPTTAGASTTRISTAGP